MRSLTTSLRSNGPKGNWKGVGATRAPMQDGDFSRTAMGIRALTVYATPARGREYTSVSARAAAWLSAQTPLTTEDRVMQLLGLHWADADARARQTRMSGAAGAPAAGRRLGADAAPGQRCLCDGAGPLYVARARRACRRRRAATRRRLLCCARNATTGPGMSRAGR